MTAADKIVDYVQDFYAANDAGPTRRDIAEFFGIKQTRNIAGVRTAINEQRICYDGTTAGRLIPWSEHNHRYGT